MPFQGQFGGGRGILYISSSKYLSSSAGTFKNKFRPLAKSDIVLSSAEMIPMMVGAAERATPT